MSGVDLEGGKLEREVVRKKKKDQWEGRRGMEQLNSLLAVGNNSASGSSHSSSGKKIEDKDEFLWTQKTKLKN